MEIIRSLPIIVGEFLDCQLVKDVLYLWDFNGDVRSIDYQKIMDLYKENGKCYLQSGDIMFCKTNNPTSNLPIDTFVMQGNIYLSTESGLYRGYALNSKGKKTFSSRPAKIWDAKVLAISKKESSPILALSAGSDGLFELNLSMYKSQNLRYIDKDITKVSDLHSNYAYYRGIDIDSISYTESWTAKFLQEPKKRSFEGIENNNLLNTIVNKVPYLKKKHQLHYSNIVQYRQYDDFEIFEFDDGLLVIQDGNIVLKIDEEIVRWRTIKRDNVYSFLFIILNDRIEIYEIFSSVYRDIPEKSKKISEKYILENFGIITHNIFDLLHKDIGSKATALGKFVKEVRGIANIDFIDGENWDQIESVDFNSSNGFMSIYKNSMSFLTDNAAQEGYRMVWGNSDTFIVSFKLKDICVTKNEKRPFIILWAKACDFEDFMPELVRKGYQILGRRNLADGYEIIVKKDAHQMCCRFYNRDFPIATISGKNYYWDAHDSFWAMISCKLNTGKKTIDYLNLLELEQKVDHIDEFKKPFRESLLDIYEAISQETLFIELLCYRFSLAITDKEICKVEDNIEGYWNFLSSILPKDAFLIVDKMVKSVVKLDIESSYEEWNLALTAIINNIDRIIAKVNLKNGYNY